MEDSRGSATGNAAGDEPGVTASRRQLLAMAAVGGVGAAAVAGATPASAHDRHQQHGRARGTTFRLTVLGTTDPTATCSTGTTSRTPSTTTARAQRRRPGQDLDPGHGDAAGAGAASCLTLDAGDTIQGTPLAYYFAKIEPITEGHVHPMAAAMNAIGYDAAALGNHEFNYGIDMLRTFQRQLRLPAAGRQRGRLDDRGARLPAVRHQAGPHAGRQADVMVGILGLVTPGVAIWDKANVEGKVEFPGIVEQAAGVRAPSSSAPAPTSSSSRPLRLQDVLVVRRRAALPRERQHPAGTTGPGHRRHPRRARPPGDPRALRHQREDRQAGPAVRAAQVGHAADGHGPRPRAGAAAAGPSGPPTPTCSTPTRCPRTAQWHSCSPGTTRSCASTSTRVIGSNVTAMSAATSRFEDTAAMDFINFVQADRPSGRPWPAPPTRRPRCCRSPPRSTATRRSRRVT